MIIEFVLDPTAWAAPAVAIFRFFTVDSCLGLSKKKLLVTVLGWTSPAVGLDLCCKV